VILSEGSSRSLTADLKPLIAHTRCGWLRERCGKFHHGRWDASLWHRQSRKM
jgi:hypothetical protein